MAHEKNPHRGEVVLNMNVDNSKTPELKYQAAMAIRGSVDWKKDTIEEGERRPNAREALRSLHHKVCIVEFTADLEFSNFRQKHGC
jgi:hypothetical protein